MPKEIIILIRVQNSRGRSKMAEDGNPDVFIRIENPRTLNVEAVAVDDNDMSEDDDLDLRLEEDEEEEEEEEAGVKDNKAAAGEVALEGQSSVWPRRPEVALDDREQLTRLIKTFQKEEEILAIVTNLCISC